MVTAAAQLKAQGIETNLVFVGADSENVGIDKLAAEAGVADSVWLYGPCYDDKQLAELFYNAAVCVSPGNVGLTAIHALSFGCPVVTHNNLPWQGPEFECIKAGVTGDFFRQYDADDLTRVVSKWLRRTDEERDATAAAAFAEIDARWNVDHQIEIFKTVLT